MIKKPRGINLGLAAGIGAAASLLFGTVTVNDAIRAFGDIWDAALAFVGIVTLSVTLDALGFFKWAALRVARLAGGSGLKLYFYVSLFTASISILFANDSAVLILTPIVLEVVSQLKMNKESRLAYLFAAGLIADTAATPLITSNPVNIVSADFFGYTFIEHLIFMGPVALVTIFISLFVIYIFFRKSIPRSYPSNLVDDLTMGGPVIGPLQLKASILALVAIDLGYVVASLNEIPVSVVICSGALFLLLFYWLTYREKEIVEPPANDPSNADTGAKRISKERKGILGILKEVNWDILVFMVSIFLVVQGLKHAGAIDFFAFLFVETLALPSVFSVLVPSLIVTVSASAMNNWPMTMLGLLSIKQAAISNQLGPQACTTLIFANVIGNNLGPHFFPLGSLAILMWLGVMKKKGLTIRFIDYLKVGAVLSILEVVTASVVLWAEQNYLQISLSLPQLVR
jgi:arsenical pump membrane protein